MAVADGFYDPINDIIYNRLGVTDKAELRQLEGDYSIPAMLRVVVGSVLVPGQFDADHLKRIHKELFQDVYGWAGETRANGPNGTFQGEKSTFVLNPNGDTMRYGPHGQLDQRLDAIGGQLSQENNLRGLGPEQFAQRAAYYFDQYNHTHAFREGNGRTLQALMATLGREAGYQVELTVNAADRLNNVRDFAIIRPLGPEQPARNLEPLAMLLAAATDPLPGPEAAQRRDPSQARPLSGPLPAVQRIEALRVMQASSWVIGAALRDIDRGDTDRANQLVAAVADLVHERVPAAQHGSLIQQAALEVAQHPLLGKELATVEHAAWLGRSVHQMAMLDEQGAPRLTPPKFTLAEVPAGLLKQLGNSVEQLATQPAQLNKLLWGEKTDPIPGFSLPPRAGIAPADLGPFAAQLLLQRDAAGNAKLLFDMPEKQREMIKAVGQAKGPAAPDLKAPAAPDLKPPTKPEAPKEAPKPKGPKPRR